MDIQEFKKIYYPEWAHRIVGRSIGLIVLGPMVYFWGRGYLRPTLKKALLILFTLGAL